MLAKNPWEMTPEELAAASGAPAARQPGPLFTVPARAPDPMDLRRDARDDTRLAYTQRDDARANQREARDTRKEPFERGDKLRDDYNQSPVVKAYNEALPAYADALQTKADPQGDLFLMYRAAKVLDPLGSVREGDTDLINSTSPIIASLAAKYEKELRGGGSFPSDVREGLRRELATSMAALNRQFIGARVRYKETADRQNVNPLDVVGEHPAVAFQQIEANAFGKPVALLDYEGDDRIGAVLPDKPAPGPDTPLEVSVEGGRLPKRGEPGYEDYLRAGWKEGPDGLVNPSSVGPGATSFLSGVGDLVEGAGKTLGVVGNPLNAGINALTGWNLSTDLGKTLRDATGLPDTSTPVVKGINEGAAGALTFGGGLSQVARGATGVTRAALTSFAGTPTVNAFAGAGAGAGGESARMAGAGPVGQTVGALAGGLAAAPLGARMAFGASAPPVRNALVDAGRAENVGVNRAMVAPAIQPRVVGAEATMLGSPIIQGSMRKVGNEIEAGVTRLGRGGTALEPAVAGETIRNAATRNIAELGQRSSRLYKRAEAAAGDAKIEAASARAEIDGMLAKLNETPNTNRAEIAYLTDLKGDVANGVSVGGLRDLKTTLRKRIGKGELTFGQNEARVLGIMDAITNDIETGLRTQGKGDAAQLFRQADDGYREKQDFIVNTVQKVIGKRNANLPPERVLANFKAMASPKGDEAGLAKMVRSMKDDEGADIAATFASELGRNNKGEFSTAFLASQAQKLPQAARVNLFGVEGAKSLANLELLAKEHARVVGGLNASRTGTAMDYKSWLTNLALGGGGGLALGQSALTAGAGGAAVLGVKAARDIMTARMAMSQDVVKWLARAPKTQDPAAINRHFSQLARIGVTNPALQADIQAFSQRIMAAANDNVGTMTRSVASDGTERQDDEQRR